MQLVIEIFLCLSESILGITEQELREISGREGLSAKKIRLSWTRQLVEYLAGQGFDNKYGARQLQRTIERLLVTPLARYPVAHHLDVMVCY